MKTISLFSALFLFLNFSLLAQDRELPPISFEKISDNLYQILGGKGANGGVYIGENGVLVIDSKMEEEWVTQTIDAIKGITDKPIKYLVNTHSDGDHIMGNRWFPESITFVAHENCRDDFFKVNFGRESDWDGPQFFNYVPSLTFKNEMTLWLGHDKVELHYFGIGHTTGDCVVYFPSEKAAFVGDQYFSNRPQLIHSNKNGNSFEHVKTLNKMMETLDAEKFYSGHSEVVGREEIKSHIKSMIDRQEKVRTLIKEGKQMEEVLASFDKKETRLVTSIFNEINAE